MEEEDIAATKNVITDDTGNTVTTINSATSKNTNNGVFCFFKLRSSVPQSSSSSWSSTLPRSVSISYPFAASPLFSSRIPALSHTLSHTFDIYTYVRRLQTLNKNLPLAVVEDVPLAVVEDQAVPAVENQPLADVVDDLPPQVQHIIRVIVIGQKSTGKTTFLDCFPNEREGGRWIIQFPIEGGFIRFVCDEMIELEDAYIRQTDRTYDAAVLLLDASNASTIQSARVAYASLFMYMGSNAAKPIITACNKSEVRRGKNFNPEPKIDVGVEASVYYISARQHVNIKKPFLEIARKVIGRPDINF